jgi:LPS sulfotransferase NodH
MRYAILHTPRTGSNVLCDCLVQTNMAGMRDLMDAGFFIGYGASTPQAYQSGAVDAYFKRNETPNGIQGCKIGWDYIEHLNKCLGWGEVDKILTSFDRFILLTRDDVVAQAVSRAFARLSKKWTSLDSPDDEVVDMEGKYNQDRISYFISQMAGHNKSIQVWLDLHRVNPLHMTYEDNSLDWQAAVETLLHFIGVHTNVPLISPKLQKQSHPLKTAWIQQYKESIHNVRSV